MAKTLLDAFKSEVTRISKNRQGASNALFGKKSQSLTFTPQYDTSRICTKAWRQSNDSTYLGKREGKAPR